MQVALEIRLDGGDVAFLERPSSGYVEFKVALAFAKIDPATTAVVECGCVMFGGVGELNGLGTVHVDSAERLV